MQEVKTFNECKGSITLPMILEQFAEEGQDLMWSILHLEASGNLGHDKSIVDFENLILSKPSGYLLPWTELWALANKFWLVINCTLIGCKDEKTILSIAKKRTQMEDTLKRSEIAVGIDDGEFYSFFAKDITIVDRINKCFGPLPVQVYG